MGTKAPNEWHAAYQKNRYDRTKVRALDLLGGVCSFCGSDDSLEFDHIDPTTKEYNVSTMLSKYSWARVKEELAKCQLLCVDCHRTRTAEQTRLRSSTERATRS